MSGAERDKWDARYRAGSYGDRPHPTALLEAWAGRLPRGRALDVACGAGRNALFLAALGYRVDAVDISPVGLERGRVAADARGVEVRWLAGDLDHDPAGLLPEARYDLIVWVRYVNPGLLPHLVRRLSDGGCLLCEQHLSVTTEEVVGPSGPSFRLRAGELSRSVVACARASSVQLRVLHDYEGLVDDPDGRRAALAQLIARRVRGRASEQCRTLFDDRSR
jgi:SAM-dependent methyltransferase